MMTTGTSGQGSGSNRWPRERRLIIIGFVAAAVILLLVGLESYRDTIRVADAAATRKHSFEVQGLIADTAARLVDAETGQRGFLLTGDETYLEPYHAAIKNVDRLVGELRNFTADNPNQQRRILELEPLIGKKLAELERTIDLRKTQGLMAANAVVLGGEGKRWMDQIRVVLADMQKEEDHVRALRTEEMTDALSRTSRIVVAGNLLSASLLFVVFVLLFRALSARKRAQEALEKSETWLSTTLSSIGDAVIATDMNGAVSFMNPVAQSLTGWSLDDARGKSMDLVFDIVNKETRRPVENPVKKVFREGKVVGLADHTILLSRSGKEFDIEDSAAPIVTDMGAASGVVLVFRDITEKKLAEEETGRQKDLLQLILGSVSDGVVVADTNGKFLLFNAAAERFIGVGATDASPDKWSHQYGSFLPDGVTVFPPNELPLVRAMRGESLDAVELITRNAKVPEGRLLSISGRPLRGEDGALKGGVVVLHDITLQKRAQEALLQAKEEAERTSKFKDQFLSTMSHELRTPLNAVLGFSDLLADPRYGPLNEKQRRYIDHIHTGGKHLLSLISDILDLSKIEAGRMELAMESITVDAAFAEVLSVMQPLADKKSHVLCKSVEAGLAVRADATRFKQVLMNLVGNAIKFTPNGGRIELAAHLGGGSVRMEVQDNGPGIPPEEQKRIFEAFYRLRESGKKTEGTGLGLAITQRLVELHGGELGLKSQVGQGSCFYFALPAVASAQEPLTRKTESASRSLGPQRILVIEDDRVTAQLIQSQLSSAGYQVTLCEEPQKALDVAAQLQPSAITLDIVMKPKNGWEVLVQLKRDARTAHIPMIVVSIVDQPSMGTLLGADEYLVKPVDKTTLLDAIARHAGTQRGTKRTGEILVVEDDTPTREFIAEMLSAQGYAVATAADGAQARAQVAASLPQLVILDMMLPEVSGFELLGEWRASLRTAGLPVFVLTSKDLSQEEQSYLRTHAEALFRKQQPWHKALIKQLERVAPRVAEKV
jgi:PAS domain S-box-containing protein